MKLISPSLLLTCLITFNCYAKSEIKLCYLRHWYPYTYFDEGDKGIYIDLIRDVSNSIHTDIILKPSSYNQCMKYAREDKIDGIIGLGYSDTNRKVFDFPDDIEKLETSKKKLGQISYYLITHSINRRGQLKDRLNLGKDIHKFPFPIRIEKNFFLKNITSADTQDLIIRKGYNFIQINELLKSKIGSMIINESFLDEIRAYPEISSNFLVQDIPVATQDFFVVFTPNSILSTMEKQVIWNELSHMINKS